MNYLKYLNPSLLIERLALASKQKGRLGKLKNTVGKSLKIGHIDSLELLEIILNENPELKKSAVIYDIGSNIGTWTLLAKSLFPSAEVHAFEPLNIHIEKFEANTKKIQQVYMHPFCLGDENTNSVINVSSFSDSSSLLNATQLEFKEFGIKKASEEKVQIKRLDNLIEDKKLPVPDIMKLDVQGFELEVLKGAGKYLSEADYLIVEVSFREYYYGQPLFLDIANYLSACNFNIHAFGHSTPLGRELGQIDVLFKKQ